MIAFRAFFPGVALLALAAALAAAAGVLGAEAAPPAPPATADQLTAPGESPTPTSMIPAPPTPAAAPPPVSAATDSTSTTAAPAVRDPTVPTADLRSVLDKNRRAAVPAVRPAPPPKLPEIVRRAFIQVAGKPPQAIIEAGAARHTVAAGSQFTVDAGQGASLALRVIRLTADEIEIEIPSLHQTLVVR